MLDPSCRILTCVYYNYASNLFASTPQLLLAGIHAIRAEFVEVSGLLTHISIMPHYSQTSVRTFHSTLPTRRASSAKRGSEWSESKSGSREIDLIAGCLSSAALLSHVKA